MINITLETALVIGTLVALVFSFGAMIWSKQDKKACIVHSDLLKAVELSVTKLTEQVTSNNIIIQNQFTSNNTNIQYRFDDIQRQVDNLQHSIDIISRLDRMEEKLNKENKDVICNK